jgi:hypothetical protein
MENSQRDKLSDYYSKPLRDLVDYIIIYLDEKRPTIEQILLQTIVRAELNKILEDFITLTFDFSTAPSAHQVLEQIVEIQCVLSKWCDYGLPMNDKSKLRVANTKDTEFLLQGELKAIN